jgi:hypothetical protein
MYVCMYVLMFDTEERKNKRGVRVLLLDRCECVCMCVCMC